MRSLLFLGLLAAAVGVPYLTTQGDKLSGLTSMWKSKPAKPTSAGDFSLAGATGQPPGPTAPGAILTPQTVPLEGLPTYDLAEVFRMDVSPDWVYQRWSRKSTALADLDRYGVRVPLVTGTLVDDLAGSITYYFDEEGQVEHISFTGRTGDPRRLIQLVTNVYAFHAQAPDVPGEQLFQVRWNGQPTSELRIRPADVLWANSPHTSYQVELELARPGSSKYLPQPQPAVQIPKPNQTAQQPAAAP